VIEQLRNLRCRIFHSTVLRPVADKQLQLGERCHRACAIARTNSLATGRKSSGITEFMTTWKTRLGQTEAPPIQLRPGN
jgi:hypothetical protein